MRRQPLHFSRGGIAKSANATPMLAARDDAEFALEADRSHVWHPFTQMSTYAGHQRMIVRGDGNYLIDVERRRVFDAASSIWLNVHGHCHPRIVRAIAEQAATLDHATLLGQSNVPSALLAQRLAGLLPPNLRRVFFSGDGASAVEAALKIAVQYWHNQGNPRSLFVAHERGYHGDTTGAMSVSGLADFLRAFDRLRFPTVQLVWGEGYLDDLGAVLRDRRAEIAAVIVEPIVQAAGGVRLMSASTLARAADLCRRFGVLVVVDEIATGFGRSGTMFAFEQAGIVPDVVVLGKALTGGTLPLSATVASEEVYAAFLGEYREARHFFHGHSYAGNPIACAAALANLDVFDEEHTLERVRAQLPAWYAALSELAGRRAIREVRRHGYFAGVELRDGLAPGRGASPTRAWEVCDLLWERGFFVRPIGPTLLLVPPLSSSADELASLLHAVDVAVDLVSTKDGATP